MTVSTRYESLTLWRGLACLMVVVFHALIAGYPHGGPTGPLIDLLKMGWLGVPIFFVISGYCITASADNLRQNDHSAGEFFWRRFRRIYPPYWICVGVTLSMVALFPTIFASSLSTFNSLTGLQWLGNITLTESWIHNPFHGIQALVLSPAWTLCYEEQFYLVVGLLLLLCRRWFFLAVTILTGLVLVGLYVLPFNTDGTFLDGKWFMFAAGINAYYVLNYAGKNRRWLLLLLVVGVMAAIADPVQLLRPGCNEPNKSYLVAFLFALVMIGIHKFDGVLLKCRALFPLRYCGEMCFSLYLVHWPVVMIVGRVWNYPPGILGWTAVLVGSVFLTVMIGRMFHLLVERHFLTRPKNNLEPTS
jgi:peptidoglycan/LPS O-acetylase OafA/YrhL